jgi:purine-binding chemotaxis protein CheW
MIFNLDGERFAVDASHVRETVWLPELTPVEEVPPWVIGLFNLRGQIVNVIDLQIRFGHPARHYLLSDQVVVLQLEQQLTGLIVAEVDDVVEVAADSIQPLPLHSETHQPPNLVTGEVRVGENLVAVLDLSRLTHVESGSAQAAKPHVSVKPGGYFCPQASPETQSLFHDRAVALQKSGIEYEGEPLGLAVVELGGEYFGIELAAVQEFCRVVQVSPIPCCPSHILGAISLRGDLLTLIDPSAAFNLPPVGDNVKAVVGHIGEQAVALAVDEVHDAVYIQAEGLQPPPAFLREQHGSAITGTASYADSMMTVLDLSALLAREEWIVDERA